MEDWDRDVIAEGALVVAFGSVVGALLGLAAGLAGLTWGGRALL